MSSKISFNTKEVAVLERTTSLEVEVLRGIDYKAMNKVINQMLSPMEVSYLIKHLGEDIKEYLPIVTPYWTGTVKQNPVLKGSCFGRIKDFRKGGRLVLDKEQAVKIPKWFKNSLTGSYIKKWREVKEGTYLPLTEGIPNNMGEISRSAWEKGEVGAIALIQEEDKYIFKTVNLSVQEWNIFLRKKSQEKGENLNSTRYLH
jgi:hypothetical protein